MKELVTPEMEAHLAGTVTSLATIWRITRVNGESIYLTDHDVDITYSGNTYKTELGTNRSSIESGDKLAVKETEIEGIIDVDDISEDQIRAGLWNHAEVEVALVNWQDLTMGEIPLLYGRIGEITIESEHVYKSEIAGPVRNLQQNLLEQYQVDCRADLGDDKCRIPISPPVISRAMTVLEGDCYRYPSGLQNTYWSNIVTNPSYESDATATDTTTVTGWTVVSGLWDIKGTLWDPQDGDRFMEGGTSASGEIRQDVDLVSIGMIAANADAGGVDITFSCWRKQDFATDTGQVIVEALDGALSVIGTLYDSGDEEISPTSVWAVRTLGATALPSGTRHIRVRFLYTRVNTPKCWSAIDNVVVTMIDNIEALNHHKSHPNTINNPWFDIDALGENVQVTGWEIVSGEWDLHDATNNGLAPQFSSAYLEGGFGNTGEIRQTILFGDLGIPVENVDSGDVDWGLSVFRANSTSDGDLGQIILEGLTASGTPIGTLYNSGLEAISPEDSWVLRSASGTVGTNIRQLRLRLLYQRTAGLQANTAFDNITLTLTDRSGLSPYREIYENLVYQVKTSGVTDTRSVPYNAVVGLPTTDGTAVLVAQDAWARHGYIQSVLDQTRVRLNLTEPRANDDWFNYGALVFETGRNAGRAVEVRDWTSVGKVLEFYLPPGFLPVTGDLFWIYRGCDKLLDTCADVFDNVVNYRGEPFIPGSDILQEYPRQA